MNQKIIYTACVALASLTCLVAAATPTHAAQFKTLYKFTSRQKTQGVEGALAVLDNILYGATEEGGTGPESNGTIFKFDLSSQKEITLVNFTGTTSGNKGQAPIGPLSVVGHSIFGSTAVGGLIDQNQPFRFRGDLEAKRA